RGHLARGAAQSRQEDVHSAIARRATEERAGRALVRARCIHGKSRTITMARFIEPVTLRSEHATLEPLTRDHVPALATAAEDGELWRLWYTGVAPPDRMDQYVATALDMRERLDAMPFVVRENATGDIVGCTRYF